mgnify:CR=1 FL=1|jgi:hypothetical protein|tara:strand:- start:162 stop:371 length:210 start_codon:yes stop_codon:yes gene_type:complete
MDAVSRYLDQEYLILHVQQLEQDLLDMKHRCETAETEVLSLGEIVKLKDLQIKELQIEGLMHRTEMQSF